MMRANKTDAPNPRDCVSVPWPAPVAPGRWDVSCRITPSRYGHD
jgi:hypothetical protein